MSIRTSVKQLRDRLGERELVFNETTGGESEDHDPLGMNAAGFEFERWSSVDSHLRGARGLSQCTTQQRSLLSSAATALFPLGRAVTSHVSRGPFRE